MLRVQYFLKTLILTVIIFIFLTYSVKDMIFEYVLLPKSFPSGTVLRIENFVKVSFGSCCTAASLFSLQSNPSVRHLTSIVLPWKEANLKNLNGEGNVSKFNQSGVIIVFFSCFCCLYLYLTLCLKRWPWCKIDWWAAPVFLSLPFFIRISSFSFEKDDRGAVEGGNLD